MTKITAEDFKIAIGTEAYEISLRYTKAQIIGMYLELLGKYRTPTFDDVVMAWKKWDKEVKVEVHKNSVLITESGFRCPTTIINLDEVYIADGVTIRINRIKLNAINLTIRYLESQKEKKNE